MGIATAAGAFYAFMVFLIGFVFGTIRILVLAPRLGETAAVVLETPIMLAASWFVCRWCVDRLGVPRRVIARSVMGAAAFVVLMSAEVAWPCSYSDDPLPSTLRPMVWFGSDRACRTDCLRYVSGRAALEAIRRLTPRLR
jgi:hypothetical protein